MRKRKIKYRSPHGFNFTKDDEARMELAKASASQFMKGYGKGRKPYTIDYSHYYSTKRNDGI